LILGAGVSVGIGLTGGGVAAAQPGPACPPATLDNSALQAGAVTVSPLAGSRDASPDSQISFLGLPAAALRQVSVVGTQTGSHSGRLEPYSQGDGASFLPARPFAEGERVSVSARVRLGGRTLELSDEFAVAHEDRISTTPRKIVPGVAGEEQSFHSRPELHPPTVAVTAQSPAVAEGDEFVAPYGGPGQAGPMILEPDGALVWFKPLPTHTEATNLQVQEYEGKPVLTWWQGNISEHGFGLGEDVIADQTYTDIAHVRAGNGLQADLHEFQLTPQGTALITAYEPIYCDLAALGGPEDGAVTDSVFQEIDVRTGLVMYEWSSLDHVGLDESYERASTTSDAHPFDFFHLNSISPARDGSLLISSRNTWTVYDLDPASGQILWRLGGKHSSFKMGAGTGTAWQHDPRELPDGAISLFDNGDSPKEHSQSRAIVLSLVGAPGTATLVDRLTHTPPLLAESQGSVQALANGDWFVGWGQEPYFSEFGPTGTMLFDAHFPTHDESYRAFRFAWSGTPAHAPAFAFAPGAAGQAGTVYASWNGATGVAAWRVLAGSSPASLAQVAQATREGFETAIAVPAATAGPDMAVQALGASGQVLDTSATATETGLAGG
ncbi:MAG TPA: arylsulfotransferase family protein, partial [Solirubrobacteraceae bacterium]|nr:arylsulfotransferase family protein [Solirubrobacteraceae bacterium]